MLVDDERITWDQIEKRFEKFDALTKERLEAAKELTGQKFYADVVALQKASAAIETRFQSVNEFRQTLVDQNVTFVRTTEFSVLSDKVSKLENLVTGITSRLSNVTSGPTFLFGSIGSLVVIFIALVSGAVQLGSLQTHVSITSDDVAKLKNDETARIIEHANENVERGNLHTRLDIAIKDIDQLNQDERQKLPTLESIVERLSKLEVELKTGK
jgi:prophage DNA circulation protein